jgi:ABC-type Mn2+/Zn2+ transport system permease subunit
MLTNSFGRMLWLSSAIGGACGLVGMYLSYHLDVSSGATIVLVGATLFCVVFSVTGRVPTSGGRSAVTSLTID